MGEPAKVSELWEQRLIMTDRGYARSAGNVALILEHDPHWRGQLRFDERADSIVVRPGAPISGSDAERAYDAEDDTRLAIWLEQSKYGIRIDPGSSALSGAVNVTAHRDAYDPVKDWLESLRWDGTPRISAWLEIYLGATSEDDKRRLLYSAYGRCWLISGVARAFVPGCQVDHTLVLVGPQGAKKSSALRTLASRPEWFTDSIPSLSDKKAAAEVLRGRWIVEHGELDQIGRAEISTVKAWLTAQCDSYRAAYARRAVDHPRRCVFAASTNEDAFLRDATGGRRFWPVAIGTIDLAAIERDREQLWAEAVHAYRSGELWHIVDPDLVEAAQASQDERYQVDAWEPAIEEYLARNKRVTIPDVLEHALELKIERWDQPAQNRVARCLQHLGWRRRQVRDGKARQWVYEKAVP